MSWEVFSTALGKQGGGICTKHDGAASQFHCKTNGEQEGRRGEGEEPTQNMTVYISKVDQEH